MENKMPVKSRIRRKKSVIKSAKTKKRSLKRSKVVKRRTSLQKKKLSFAFGNPSKLEYLRDGLLRSRKADIKQIEKLLTSYDKYEFGYDETNIKTELVEAALNHSDMDLLKFTLEYFPPPDYPVPVKQLVQFKLNRLSESTSFDVNLLHELKKIGLIDSWLSFFTRISRRSHNQEPISIENAIKVGSIAADHFDEESSEASRKQDEAQVVNSMKFIARDIEDFGNAFLLRMFDQLLEKWRSNSGLDLYLSPQLPAKKEDSDEEEVLDEDDWDDTVGKPESAGPRGKFIGWPDMKDKFVEVEGRRYSLFLYDFPKDTNARYFVLGLDTRWPFVSEIFEKASSRVSHLIKYPIVIIEYVLREGKREVYIEYFYQSATAFKGAYAFEKELFKGFGKKVMCVLLHHIDINYPGKYDTVKLLQNAGVGESSYSKSVTVDEALLASRFLGEVCEFHDLPTLQQLMDSQSARNLLYDQYLSAQKQISLRTYYEKNFGFKPTKDVVAKCRGLELQAPLKTCIQMCARKEIPAFDIFDMLQVTNPSARELSSKMPWISKLQSAVKMSKSSSSSSGSSSTRSNISISPARKRSRSKTSSLSGSMKSSSSNSQTRKRARSRS
jgi:hypothetical protein